MGLFRSSISLLAVLLVALNAFAPAQQNSAAASPPAQMISPAVLQGQRDQGIADGVLDGHYALVFSGYKNGTPIIMAGSFVADGAGHITSGVLDVNDGSGEAIVNHNVVPQTLTTASGYSLTAGRLGTMTLVTNAATYKFKIVVSFNACVANQQFLSTCGRVIQSDSSNPQDYGSGVIKVQNPQYFSIFTFFPGNFAYQITGTDPGGNRYAAAGALGTNAGTLVDIDCSNDTGGNGWGLDGCPLDVNDNGRAAATPVKGTFAGAIDHDTGRGPFVNLSFPMDPELFCGGRLGSPGCNYAYYVIDKQQMVMISADPVSHPANLVLWTLVRQSPPPGGWTSASLSGTSVLELSAVDTNGGNPLADISAGLLTADRLGHATLSSDENRGGSWLQQQVSQGTYTITLSGRKTGRVSLQGFSTQFGASAPVVYLSAPNTGFVIGTDAESSAGVLEPQSGGPFSNASLVHTYAGGSVWPALADTTNLVGGFFADGSGNGNVTQYTSGPNGPRGPNLWILTYQTDATGRALVQQGSGLYGIAYVVSPTKAVLLPAGNAPALNVMASAPSN